MPARTMPIDVVLNMRLRSWDEILAFADVSDHLVSPYRRIAYRVYSLCQNGYKDRKSYLINRIMAKMEWK